MGSNPFNIPIGTSDPVNLCHGLPLFPALGTARAGVSSSSRSYKLFDASVTILITRLKISAYGLYAFGICGPAIAFLSRDVDVARTNSGDAGELTLTFNEGLLMSAGTFVGASAGAGVTLTLQVLTPKPWYKIWTVAWRNAFTADLDFRIDLLKTLFTLIRYLVSKSSNSLFTEDTHNRLKAAVPFVRTFSLEDTVGSTTAITPNLRATPKMTLPINVANYFPALKALNDRLSKVGGEISVGPSIHLEFPVTFNFASFTVVGGLAGAPSANYGNVQYAGNQVSAAGPTQFNTGVNPTQFTSNVTYRTGFALTLSLHLSVSLGKMFNLGANTPSLDLTYLLYGIRESDRSTAPVNGSVSTNVQNGCVLTPNMTLAFAGSNGNGTNFVTGQVVKGTVTLPDFRSTTAATVGLAIEPPVAGFPSNLTIPAGARTASFDFIFQNSCLATGDRNDPSVVAPPSALSPVATYAVGATLNSATNNVCDDFEVEVPLNITERYIRCQKTPTVTQGTVPPWDPFAGASLNANPGLPGGGPSKGVVLSLWFPFLASEPTAMVPVTFTLLDENRQPYSGSNVQIFAIPSLPPTPLKPSVTATVTLARSFGGAAGLLGLSWNSKGPHTGYSSRFYLIVNAGCQYGQAEFWLDVWNWS